ncbi:type II toxin-antitoxin system antitoxin DNA ADP-ribosyl glycohydrolase DarG [Rhodopirellula baltica]|uniref:Protein containing Appr-1-p processing domain protein n=1 Tax=Rhodopirellula baltica SWK14 TaxID=993516 RepID=L7CE66_RHOBT|nr:macro domain-containing protein [Rhodopirellula baltica]ELP32509.1 protein containing Appr-1-p processing domain protein [Rhodopirellula baltica SWK14]
MIQITRGDILQADAEALVNTVNCVGVMGRGIAAQFKKKFEANFKAYKKACDQGELKLGTVLVHDREQLLNPRYVINFPTKDHWRAKSKIEDVRTGLISLVDEVRQRKIKSIAIPPLGCGLGGLRWSQVRPMIEEAFADLSDVDVLLYEPVGAPAPEKMVRNKKQPNMTVARAAMLGLMRKYLAAVMDPFVTLLEVHKLMYFLVEVGEPIPKLRFQKAPYGPYSETLRFVLEQTEGHFTLGFADGEDDPEKAIQLLQKGIAKSDTFLQQHPETQTRFNRVADLISGFETPYGMELLATVHWVVAKDGASSLDETVGLVHGWTQRKRNLFPRRHIELAWTVLRERQLLSV